MFSKTIVAVAAVACLAPTEARMIGRVRMPAARVVRAQAGGARNFWRRAAEAPKNMHSAAEALPEQAKSVVPEAALAEQAPLNPQHLKSAQQLAQEAKVAAETAQKAQAAAEAKLAQEGRAAIEHAGADAYRAYFKDVILPEAQNVHAQAKQAVKAEHEAELLKNFDMDKYIAERVKAFEKRLQAKSAKIQQATQARAGREAEAYLKTQEGAMKAVQEPRAYIESQKQAAEAARQRGRTVKAEAENLQHLLEAEQAGAGAGAGETQEAAKGAKLVTALALSGGAAGAKARVSLRKLLLAGGAAGAAGLAVAEGDDMQEKMDNLFKPQTAVAMGTAAVTVASSAGRTGYSGITGAYDLAKRHHKPRLA